MILKGLNNNRIILEDKPFSTGGEGWIHDIVDNNTSVAKIYKPDKISRELEYKIKTMTSLNRSNLKYYAWPEDLLYNNGSFVGFTMAKIQNCVNINDIYQATSNRERIYTSFITIAQNLASAVHNIHDIGQTIGDLKPDNILVDPVSCLVTMVDTDSYHITDNKGCVYKCGVGTAQYIPAELQGKHFPSLPPNESFNHNSDNFALAVLIFQLLMNGCHPFACHTINGSASRFMPVENITHCYSPFFYTSKAAANHNIGIPVYAPDLSCLPDYLRALFRKAFIEGHFNPSLRPKPNEWSSALAKMKNELTHCPINATHLFHKDALSCPWCNVEEKLTGKKKTRYTQHTQPLKKNHPQVIQKSYVPSTLISSKSKQPEPTKCKDNKTKFWIVTLGNSFLLSLFTYLDLSSSLFAPGIFGTSNLAIILETWGPEVILLSGVGLTYFYNDFILNNGLTHYEQKHFLISIILSVIGQFMGYGLISLISVVANFLYLF